MLDDSSLLALFDSLGTPSDGRRLVMKARRDAPVRKVKCSGSNVITLSFSQKMNNHIGLESKSLEYVAARWYESLNEVLEYYAQPVELDLNLQNKKSGRPYRLQHFPDFLVLTSDGIFLDEWREEDRLRKLQVKRPGRYVRDERGWAFPTLEEHLAELGIRYRLRSAEGLPRQFVKNAIFLADYLDEDHPALDQATINSIRDVMADLAVIPLTDFIDRSLGLNAGFSMDDVYKAIADVTSPRKTRPRIM